MLQLQHAHAVPELRSTRTIAALRAARDAGILDPQDAGHLEAAWVFASRIRNQIMLVRGRGLRLVPHRQPGAGGGRRTARLRHRRILSSPGRLPPGHAARPRGGGPGVLGIGPLSREGNVTTMATSELRTITTDLPARLDRLPWGRFHWLVVIGLGTVWILDGLEVTIVGSMSEALQNPDTGLGLSSFDVGLAGAVYVAGACVGALVFGQLTDRFGRKKLFLITLALYTVATVLTAFSMNPTWYFVCRFLTGAGIGGEYAAINSAIDELIPAQYRGRIDVVINGSFWIGAAGGALLTLPLLDPTRVDPAWGWRIAFGLGAVLAVGRPAGPAQCAGEPALAVHPRPRERGRTGRRGHRGADAARRPGTRRRLRDHHHPATTHHRAPDHRQDRVHGLPETDDLVLLAVRRSGLSVQRLLLHLRRHPDHLPRRRADRRLHRDLRRSATSSARCCSAGCSTPSAG